MWPDRPGTEAPRVLADGAACDSPIDTITRSSLFVMERSRGRTLVSIDARVATEACTRDPCGHRWDTCPRHIAEVERSEGHLIRALRRPSSCFLVLPSSTQHLFHDCTQESVPFWVVWISASLERLALFVRWIHRLSSRPVKQS
jgi:hypothetical protein